MTVHTGYVSVGNQWWPHGLFPKNFEQYSKKSLCYITKTKNLLLFMNNTSNTKLSVLYITNRVIHAYIYYIVNCINSL